MRCIITIDMDGPAFQDDPMRELAGILDDLSFNIERGHDVGLIHDGEGNTVGSITITNDGTPSGQLADLRRITLGLARAYALLPGAATAPGSWYSHAMTALGTEDEA